MRAFAVVIARAAVIAWTIALSAASPVAAAPADPASCQSVRLSDIGWTDVTATTAVTAHLLTWLGYKPQIRLLSLPVTYLSMKAGGVDAFLGDWEPSGAPVIKPFLEAGGVQRISTNLTDARYTLAVPDYTFDAGLQSFGDIARFASALHSKIYGIEPGNDGNSLILRMLKTNEFGLGHFTLVESSEQGMLSQFAREIARKRAILILGWAPHPMNLHFQLRYLSGGDTVFGPNFGGATVNTIIRPHYATDCPNVARLLGQLRFSVPEESAMMAAILDAHETPDQMAGDWLAAHPDQLRGWLDGVNTVGGQPAMTAIHTASRD